MRDNEWKLEHYPIPVITIKNLCDIGIDIDHIFFECKMCRDSAISFDWSLFSEYPFEVYGVKDYLNDFYNATLSLETISTKITQSDEQEVGISFKLGYLENQRKVTEFIELLHVIMDGSN